MTTMDANACIVDTNVLVYSTVRGNPWYDHARQWLATLQNQGLGLCVTTQILREYMVILTRGDVFEKSFTSEEVLAQIEALLSYVSILDESVGAANLLRELMGRYQIRGKSIHDANIIAVILTHGIKRLATYNSADFMRCKEIFLEPIAAHNS